MKPFVQSKINCISEISKNNCLGAHTSMVEKNINRLTQLLFI